MSPDGEAIVTGAGDETLRFWNVFSKSHSNRVSVLISVVKNPVSSSSSHIEPNHFPDARTPKWIVWQGWEKMTRQKVISHNLTWLGKLFVAWLWLDPLCDLTRLDLKDWIDLKQVIYSNPRVLIKFAMCDMSGS